MAPTHMICRLSTRLTTRHVGARASRRAFTCTCQHHAAQNFVMPALSPTMTEGNISSWKVKEGDSFSSGDILLEIETDKASMDVEAADDGLMAKITMPDGSKSVKVGARIAVLAEPEDDLSSLEIPAEESTTTNESPSQEQEQKASESTPEQPKESSKTATPKASSKSTDGKPRSQSYPLYPSVQHLLHQKGIAQAEVDKIPATGPNGRLLKGDVLAYLGSVEKSYVQNQADYIVKRGHLDLSNIKVAERPPSTKREEAPAKPAAKPENVEADSHVAVPVSFVAVLATQKRIKDTLGLTLPLSTFIARASELANEDLPRGRSALTSDELFDSVLGLDKIRKKTSRGHYRPQLTTLPQASTESVQIPLRKIKKPDIIDILSGVNPKKRHNTISTTPIAGSAAVDNIFSLSVRKSEEHRARVYLERMKSVLELEPARLVL